MACYFTTKSGGVWLAQHFAATVRPIPWLLRDQIFVAQLSHRFRVCWPSTMRFLRAAGGGKLYNGRNTL